MKKGLLSILAASAVLVGCQNYDDQFDALNTQITSLKTQVEGLAGVQSDVAALKGLISSLQGAVDGVNADLSSQLEEALADIEAVEAAVADVASGEDLAAVQADLDEVGTDVDELLESDAFFNGSLEINSDATLTFAEQLGQKVKVINGSLTIKGWEGMDAARVQAIADQVLTITQNLKVRMPSSSYTGITFPELSSVADLFVAQSGSFTFPKLVSAGNVYLGENYSSKVTIIDFRALSTVTKFFTSTIDASFATSSTDTDTIDFDEAEEIHLTSIGYYTPKALTIVAEDNATVDLSAFTSQDSEGVVRSVTLNVTGASNVTLPNYKNGSFTATDVETVVLENFYGSVTISGVENLTVGQLDSDITINDQSTLTNLTVTGVKNPDDTADKSGPALDMSNQTNLENATVSGLFTTVNFTGCSNLVDLTMSATANSLTLKDNGDLSTVDLSGAINSVTLDNADDLSEVTLGHTTALGKPNGQTTALTAGSLVVKGNAKLTSLTVTKADKIKTLTIQSNAKLEVIDMPALKSVGGSSDKANVAIGGLTLALKNKLNATKITDKLDGSSSNDLGSIESSTKLETLKTYLGVAAGASVVNDVKVYFDSADLHVTEVDGGTDTELNNLKIETTAHQSKLTVMDVTKTTSVSAKKATQSWVLPGVLDNQWLAGAANQFTDTDESGIKFDYPNINDKRFELDAANNTSDASAYATRAAVIAAVGANASADGFTVTMDQTAYKTHYFIGTFVAGGAQQTVSAGGTFKVMMGSVSGTGTVATGDDLSKINSDIAIALNSAQSSFTFAIITPSFANMTNVIRVRPNVAASTVDHTPSPKWSLPGSIGISFTYGTASWSSAGTNANYGSSFTLSWAAKAINQGWTITAKNDSFLVDQSITLTSSATTFGSASALAAGSFYNGGDLDGAGSGTVDSQIGQYVRAFANATAGSSTPGNDTNKSGWL